MMDRYKPIIQRKERERGGITAAVIKLSLYFFVGAIAARVLLGNSINCIISNTNENRGLHGECNITVCMVLLLKKCHVFVRHQTYHPAK